jgi:pimeloyl-ACP methyl ester carboxylesterase
MKDLQIRPRNYVRGGYANLDIRFPYTDPILNRDLIIEGDAHIPYDMDGVIVFCHGLGQNHRSTLNIKEITDGNMAIIKVTYSGHPPVGGNLNPRIDGDITCHILDMVPEICRYKGKKIVVAHSAGCHPAMAAASRDDVSGTFLISPPYNIYNSVVKRRVGPRMGVFSSKKLGIARKIVKEFLNGKGWESSATGEQRILALDNLLISIINLEEAPELCDYAEKVSGSVRIVQGKEDKVVLYVDSERLNRDLIDNGVDTGLFLIDDAGHYPLKEKEHRDAIKDYFCEWSAGIKTKERGEKKPSERMKERFIQKPIDRMALHRHLKYLFLFDGKTDPYDFGLK